MRSGEISALFDGLKLDTRIKNSRNLLRYHLGLRGYDQFDERIQVDNGNKLDLLAGVKGFPVSRMIVHIGNKRISPKVLDDLNTLPFNRVYLLRGCNIPYRYIKGVHVLGIGLKLDPRLKDKLF